MGDHEPRRPQADPPAPSADDLADGLADAARETFGESAWEHRLAELQQVLRRRLAGDYVVDDFGFDAELTEQFLFTALRPLAEKWFRIEVYGVDNIPREGGALIVSNHSGTIPLDCLMTGLVTHDRAGRFLRMLGADLLFYPTAIGSEPHDPSIDSRDHWQRCMQGHAAANVMPLVASNRVGPERGEKYDMTFYGSSFIADGTGAKVIEADRVSETVLTATFDLELLRLQRHAWGVFRDRRPDLYQPILTLDGHTPT